MKKNFHVIQINGFRGLLVAFFTLSCLAAGFIAFPGFLAMCAWNYLASATGSFPAISFWGGLLLWGIIAFSIFIIKKRRFIVSFNAEQELSEDEVQHIISKIKTQTIHNPYMQKMHMNNINQLKPFNNNIKPETNKDLSKVSDSKEEVSSDKKEE